MGKKQIKNKSKKEKILEEDKKRKIDEEEGFYSDGVPEQANRETPPWALISKW